MKPGHLASKNKCKEIKVKENKNKVAFKESCPNFYEFSIFFLNYEKKINPFIEEGHSCFMIILIKLGANEKVKKGRKKRGRK